MSEEREQMPEQEYEEQRVGPPDRRYYQRPRETNWPVIFTALITVLIATIGYATTVMKDIYREVRATADRQIEYNAAWKSEKDVLRRDLDKAQNSIDTVVMAFQWNVQGRLNYLEYKTGFKAPKESLVPPQPAQMQGE